MINLVTEEARELVRKGTLIGGIALAVFWALGRAFGDSPGIIWFDAVAAILSLGTAALVDESSGDAARAFGPALIGLGLGVLFIVGLSTRQPAWATWVNLLFALAYLGLAAVAVNPSLVPARAQRRAR